MRSNYPRPRRGPIRIWVCRLEGRPTRPLHRLGPCHQLAQPGHGRDQHQTPAAALVPRALLSLALAIVGHASPAAGLTRPLSAALRPAGDALQRHPPRRHLLLDRQLDSCGPDARTPLARRSQPLRAPRQTHLPRANPPLLAFDPAAVNLLRPLRAVTDGLRQSRPAGTPQGLRTATRETSWNLLGPCFASTHVSEPTCACRRQCSALRRYAVPDRAMQACRLPVHTTLGSSVGRGLWSTA